MSTTEKKRIEHRKVRPSQMLIEEKYQRELDEPRARQMAEALNPALLGVPVLSCREDGKLFVIDAQHRTRACVFAGHDEPMMCEIHYGLTVEDEAGLFRRLNKSRRGLKVYDDYKAGLHEGDPVICEIDKIVRKAGLRVGRASGHKTVVAVQALNRAYHAGNLPDVLDVLGTWGDGDPNYLEATLVRSMSAFLIKWPSLIDKDHLLKKLSPMAADRVIGKLKRMRGTYDDVNPTLAAQLVFREIYNERLGKKRQLPPPDVEIHEPVAAAAE